VEVLCDAEKAKKASKKVKKKVEEKVEEVFGACSLC